MKRLVEFHLPENLPVEEKHYIGMTCKGFPMVITQDKRVVSIIKDYIFGINGSILFEISVDCPKFEQVLNSGDPDPHYIWLDPISPMLGVSN